MKYFTRSLFLLLFIPFQLLAQQVSEPSDLVLSTKFYNAENKWITFPKLPTDTVYSYGFLYIDQMAGFTFDFKGTFKVGKDAKLLPRPNPSNASMKYRLEANTRDVAVLSATRLAELGLTVEPDWLKTYKVDPKLLPTMVAWGKHYNHVGAYEKALEYLLPAYAKDPHYRGLEFELSYAYNASLQFEKAILVLNAAIAASPKDFWFFRELGYAYMASKKTLEAEAAYLKALEYCTVQKDKTEIAYNMAFMYFKLSNKQKFAEWHDKTKSFSPDESSQFLMNLNGMSEKLEDK
ncbi:MAG: hypothetical protein WKF66_15700 [Pedobacter sp.]